MSHARPRFDIQRHLTIDVHGALMALLLVLVSLLAVELAQWLIGAGVEQSETWSSASGGEQAAVGGVFALLEVLAAVSILLWVLIYRYLPDFVQKLIRSNVRYGAVLLFGAWAASLSNGLGVSTGLTVLTMLAVFSVLKVVDHVGVWWTVNNVASLTVAVVAAAATGVVLGVWFTAVFIVGLTIYDHYFANKNTWMFDLAKPLVNSYLPVIFVWPGKARFEWEFGSFEEEDADAEESAVHWGIGTADLFLPGIFVCAVVAHWGGPVVFTLPLAAWGAVVGIGVAGFRLRHEMLTRGSGAGMPAIAAGVLGGFALFAGLGVVL